MSRSDANWTAFILGELETGERAAIREAIERDPGGVEEVERIRDVSALMQECMQEYSSLELTDQQRQTILTASSLPLPGRRFGNLFSVRRFGLATAAALIVFVAGVAASRLAQIPKAAEHSANPAQGAVPNSRPGQRPILMLDRTGKLVQEIAAPAAYQSFHLSPDGKALVFDKEVSGSREIWLRDLEKGDLRRLNPSDGGSSPVWSLDGRFIIQFKRDESADWDFWVFSSQNGTSLPVLQLRSDEQDAHFSPDGRWVAYTSRETGREEIAVVPYPRPGGKHQISNGGGNAPRWREDGREIFYVSPTRTLMAVAVRISGDTLQASAPQQLFSIPGEASRFEITADGQRFILLGEPR